MTEDIDSAEKCSLGADLRMLKTTKQTTYEMRLFMMKLYRKPAVTAECIIFIRRMAIMVRKNRYWSFMQLR